MSNELQFAVGFIKRAMSQGLSESQSISILKQAISDYHSNTTSSIDPLASGLDPSTLLTLLGGTAGGMGGYMSGIPQKKTDDDHRLRNSLLGALGGSAAGYGVGQIPVESKVTTEGYHK